MVLSAEASGDIPEEISYKDLCERFAGSRRQRAQLQASLQNEIGNMFEEYIDNLALNTFDDQKRSRAQLGVLQDGKFVAKQFSQLTLNESGCIEFALSTGIGPNPQNPPTSHFATPVSLSLLHGNLRFDIAGEEVLLPAGGSLPKFAEVCQTIRRDVWLQCGQA